MTERGYPCCEHCETTVPHDPIWKRLGLKHTTPCRKCKQVERKDK